MQQSAVRARGIVAPLGGQKIVEGVSFDLYGANVGVNRPQWGWQEYVAAHALPSCRKLTAGAVSFTGTAGAQTERPQVGYVPQDAECLAPPVQLLRTSGAGTAAHCTGCLAASPCDRRPAG